MRIGFKTLLRKPEKKQLGVCIPEARKNRIQRIEPGPILGAGSFRVTGVFAVANTMMLQGIMMNGTIRLGQNLDCNGLHLPVVDIQYNMRSSDVLEEGQHGALFLACEAKPFVKAGDVLQFE